MKRQVLQHPVKKYSDLIEMAATLKNVSAIVLPTYAGWYEFDLEAIRERMKCLPFSASGKSTKRTA